MKITIKHTDSKGKQSTTFKTLEQLLQRISTDDRYETVTRFRNAVPFLTDGYQYYSGIERWRYVYPAAEFGKDGNGNDIMKKCNGLLLLKFHGAAESNADVLKRAAAMLPSTVAAFRSADDRGIVVMVAYTDRKGKLPAGEEAAEKLYEDASRLILPMYQAVVPAAIAPGKPSLKDNFMMTFDQEPYYNADAVALKIDTHTISNASVRQMDLPQPAAEAENTKGDSVAGAIKDMMGLLCSRYEYRYNTVMKYTEYLSKERGWFGYQPIDPRVMKRMTLEIQLADIHVSIRDVRNFLESDLIPNYNPIDSYLFGGNVKWDGHDHIRELAGTVPTNNPYRADWFYTWFLGMVDQWRGGTSRQYGNSVVPLLISKQGFNKSTFCRRLLPPELQWGYNDNLVLSEKRQVLQAMAQFLLVNLDEFNQISPKVQQGFLKNLIQLPTVKIKRPYGSHVEEFPRLASFIATSNMADILSDPSGNRRFISVELTGPIDVSTRPNYHQLYAQAIEALKNGERGYFDAKQTALVMQNNRNFEAELPIEQYFRLMFEPAKSEELGEYLAAAEIFDELKKKYGSQIKANSLMAFGRKLANMPGLKHKRFNSGMKYLVGRM